MQRVETTTAIATPPTMDVAGTPGYFTKGDPGAAVPATMPGQDWFNAVQEEMIAAIQAGGVTLDRTVQTQLRQSMRRLAGANVTAISASSATLTLDQIGLVLVNAAGGSITLTLPAANALTSARYRIVRTDSAATTVTVQCGGSDAVDGATSLGLELRGDVVDLVTDGSSGWWTVGGIGNKHLVTLTHRLAVANTTERSSGTANALNSVVWSGSSSLFVAVGASGTIVTSLYGPTWTVRSSGTTNALNSVVWSGSLFVAVGATGTIVTSADGITWAVRSSSTTNALNSVVWSGSLFVAVGASGRIVTSTDGITWTAILSGTTNALNRVIWSGSLFVAVGATGTIVTSLYGTTWTVRNSGWPTGGLVSVVWSGTLFVAVSNDGFVLTSDNYGIDWTVGATQIVNTCVFYYGGLYLIMCANGAVLRSLQIP